MQMDAKELAHLLNKPKPAADPMMDSSLEMPIMQIQANVLPDVYDDEEGKKR